MGDASVVSRSKAKGTRGENLAVEFLAEVLGPQVERRVTAGANDKGDVAGIEGVVVEVKWCADLQLGAFMREAEVEAMRGGMSFPVLMHNRRQAKTRDNYATVPWWVLRYFLRLHLDEVARRRERSERTAIDIVSFGA